MSQFIAGSVFGADTHSNGISALQLQRQLAFRYYKTAWLLCAKLRRSMLAPGRSPLAGRVEVDETEIACRSNNDPVSGGGGRSHQGKMLVVGAVEVEVGGPGRIRLSQSRRLFGYQPACLSRRQSRPGATAKPDGWSGYPGAASITHDPHIVGKIAAHFVLPWFHRIFSNLKVWASWASITGCVVSTSSPTSMNSSSASTAGAPGTPRSDRCSALPRRISRCLTKG